MDPDEIEGEHSISVDYIKESDNARVGGQDLSFTIELPAVGHIEGEQATVALAMPAMAQLPEEGVYAYEISADLGKAESSGTFRAQLTAR